MLQPRPPHRRPRRRHRALRLKAKVRADRSIVDVRTEDEIGGYLNCDWALILSFSQSSAPYEWERNILRNRPDSIVSNMKSQVRSVQKLLQTRSAGRGRSAAGQFYGTGPDATLLEWTVPI